MRTEMQRKIALPCAFLLKYSFLFDIIKIKKDGGTTMKHPIILVHGIMLKDFWHFKAFGKIESILSSEGYSVFTADHDGLGSIENNAEQLKAYVLKILEKTASDKVNIIAHSKGGLDTLYMIDRLDMSKKVASVTFLSTPHKGSVIATKIYGLPRVIRSVLAATLNFWYRLFGDKHPDALTVCRQLMSNPDGTLQVGEHEGIFMQSYSTVLEKSRDDFLMGIPLRFSRKYESLPSDGMVSVESSKYANYRGHCTDESVSHSQIIDFFAKKKKKDKIYNFYRTLARELKENGF